MDDGQQDYETAETSNFLNKNRFLIMIGGSVVVAVVLVAVSLALYSSSGAAQLDMSRPGYKDVRSQVNSSDNFQNYSSTGTLNQAAVTEFKDDFDSQATKTKSVDSFGGDPLSPAALGIELTTE